MADSDDDELPEPSAEGSEGFWYYRERTSSVECTPPQRPTHGVEFENIVARKWKIGSALLTRPTVEELSDRGIVRPPTAFLSPGLSDKLQRRPSKEVVEARGIFMTRTKAVTRSLARRSLSEQISIALERRPSREEVLATTATASSTLNEQAQHGSRAPSCGTLSPPSPYSPGWANLNPQFGHASPAQDASIWGGETYVDDYYF